MRSEHTLDVPATRFVFVHYHIFKNGGTTIESILRREFGLGFATVHGPADDSVLDGEDLTEFLRRHPRIWAISSHHLRYPKPVVPGWVIFDCCFLRHPLDRLVSLYNQFRRTGSSGPFSVRANGQTPREFMKHLVRDAPHMVNDVQVTHLANSGIFARPANERDLERATEVVRNMAVPGIVEMFDESLLAAEYFLKPAFPELRLHHNPENVSRPDRTRHSNQMPGLEQMLIDLWGADVYSDLLRLNQLDLELFRQAKIENQRRLDLIPDYQERLVEFRARRGLVHMWPSVTAPEHEPAERKIAGAASG
jgi:Sulfotransferase family